MSFELLGFRSLGQVVPIALSATAAATAGIGLTLPTLQAQLTGALALQLQVGITPPSLAASLTAALALVSALEAKIALGGPDVSLGLTVMVDVIAQLKLLIGAIEAQLNIVLDINAVLGSPGVALYRHTGTLDQLAPQLPGGNPFPGVTPIPLGVFAVAQDLGAVEAMRKVFGI